MHLAAYAAKGSYNMQVGTKLPGQIECSHAEQCTAAKVELRMTCCKAHDNMQMLYAADPEGEQIEINTIYNLFLHKF